jgi:hypothetical protein
MGRSIFAVGVLVLLTCGISAAMAGNNAGGRARLSWQNDPFEPPDHILPPWIDDLPSLPRPPAPPIVPLYLLLDGAWDIQALAVRTGESGHAVDWRTSYDLRIGNGLATHRELQRRLELHMEHRLPAR